MPPPSATTRIPFCRACETLPDEGRREACDEPRDVPERRMEAYSSSECIEVTLTSARMGYSFSG